TVASKLMAIPLKRRALYALLMTALVLLGAEGVLWIVGAPPDARRPTDYPAHLGFDAALGWQLTPGAVNRGPILREWEARWDLPAADTSDDVISPLGFRDDVLADPKPPGQKRILVLGDSSVFGSGVVIADTFSSKVEVALNGGALPPPRSVEVINAGVPAYTSYQSLVILRQALELGLDGVVIYSMNSDMMAALGGADADLQDGIRQMMRTQGRALRLLSWIRYGITQMRPVPTLARTHRVSLEEYAENLNAMIDLADTAKVVMIIPPQRGDMEHPLVDFTTVDDDLLRKLVEYEQAGPRSQRGYRAVMAWVGRQRGVPVIDAPTHLASLQRANPANYARERAMFVDPIHPSKTGHAAIAELLVPYFLDFAQ
ncbi:MAG: lysophospholipase L1-like esterase, partial [Myxococcota bacterium]